MIDKDEELREMYRKEGWGILAEAAGLDPLNVESQAREAFRFAHKWMVPKDGMHLSERKRGQIMHALEPLRNIWLAYLENNLNHEARRFWGPEDHETENDTNPGDIEIYAGRNDKRLLTLSQCREAAAVMEMLKL